TVDQERRLMSDAVARYLANVAGPAGALLLLDDLQWAGPEALDLLLSLTRPGEGAHRRLISAYRDTEARQGDALSSWLADLAQAGLVTRLALRPLAEEEAAQLHDALAPDAATAVRDQVLRRAGGVPFFVVSCAQALHLGHGDTGQVGAVP